MSLYRKHRPMSLDDVIGQGNAVAQLHTKFAADTLPHTVMFTGPSGVGKTTLARITAGMLGCDAGNIVEMNCAEVRGIDSVRDIGEQIKYRPLLGKSVCFILDEVVQLPGTTQKAFLKVLEDPPNWVYFLLCTSDTQGLLPTFLSRCFQIALHPLSTDDLEQLVSKVLDAEGVLEQGHPAITPSMIACVSKNANGSARKVLQLLEAAMACDGEFEALRAVEGASEGVEEKAEFLGRMLCKGSFNWIELVKSVKDVDQNNLETLRRQVLGYASAVLTSNLHTMPAAKLAYRVIKAFKEPWFNSGKAGLLLALYEIVVGPSNN